jgi:undecaprenyl-diphosphatase
VIGIAQAIAIIPGISRSGLTVGAALLLGVKKDEAVRFSFLLSLPAILGGAVLKLAKAGVESAPGAGAVTGAAPAAVSSAALPGVSGPSLVVGTLVAFLFALIAAKALLGVVRRGKLEYFGYYCILVGAAFLIYTWC